MVRGGSGRALAARSRRTGRPLRVVSELDEAGARALELQRLKAELVVGNRAFDFPLCHV